MCHVEHWSPIYLETKRNITDIDLSHLHCDISDHRYEVVHLAEASFGCWTHSLHISNLESQTLHLSSNTHERKHDKTAVKID